MEKFEQTISKLKREKGSVTLFVLIAMIFFLVILFTWFANVKNKITEQEKEIKIIQNEYNASDIDKKYSQTIDNLDLNLVITLYKENGEAYSVTEWTNQNLKLQIFYPDDVADNEKYFYIDGVKTQYTDNCTIAENCTISVKYQNKTRQVKITRIDKVAPTVQIFPNGADIRTNQETGTITAQIKGTDNSSGIKKIKYAWSTSNTEAPEDNEYQEIQNGGTITKEYPLGTYYLWIKVTDIAGNEVNTVSNSYTIREPLPPTVTMRYTNLLGELYTGEWTNEDVYTEITVPAAEGNVEKYEYSKDGVDWKEISSEIQPTELNYTITFPMTSENKPEWLGDLTANGTYYFVEDGNGSIVSNNDTKANQVANSYIKIDLTEFDEGDLLNISVNAQVSSEGNYDWGYATITETTATPSYDNSTGQFIKISGTSLDATTPTDYPINELLKGGKIYYLHFGYRKDGSANGGNDNFTINSITLFSETLGKGINFYEYIKNKNTITYKLQEDLNCDLYFRALYDDSSYSKESDSYQIKIDKTAPTASLDYDFTGEDSSTITISNIIESGSGFKGYYISTEGEQPTKESEWIETSENEINIQNLSTNTIYYVWLIDNVGNISDEYEIEISSPNYVVDNQIYTKTLEQAINNAVDSSEIKLLNDYTDDSTATIDQNITLDIQDYILTRTKVITVNSGKEVTITGEGTITSNTNNYTISNSGTLNINMQGKIESTTASTSYGAIYNYRGVTNLYEGSVEGYYGIYQDAGTLTINAGNVIGTGAYGIYVYGNSKTIINGGNIKGKTYGIDQYNGTLTINNGNIEGDFGIYQNSNATVNILGGKIEGKTYGVYGTSNNKITIGNINLEVNEKSPIISGGLYGIYMSSTSYSYKFNNGIIMGINTIPHTETVVPREGYMVYTYYDYTGYKKYCSVLTTTVNEITIEQTPTEWTNEDVEVLVKYPVLNETTLQFSEDKENWKDVNNGYRTNITENKTIYARMLDSSGIIIAEAEHEITNIDRISPTVAINPEKTKYVIYDHGTSSVNISTTVTFADEGGSGLNTSYYGWSTSREEEPSQWFELESGDTINKENCDIGTYYLWFNISDNAGNKSEIAKIRYIVELQEAVAKIGDNYYYTIQDAFDAAETTPATVEIIKDTDEVATVQEGQTITLDLQGHTVGSSTSEQAVITNNGTLTIIDTSETKTGTIENLVGTGIQNNGTLTIGDNSNNIEDSTPTISGKKKGITNNNTLNYYDGTITGKIAIEGEVQETPESYGPVGVYENGVTKVNLRVVSDYVARIEWFYYSTLQSAIDACEARENNKDQTTVIMLKDIVLDNGANVYYGQNVRLDLHGHILTSLNDTVITNYGKLDITDLSGEQTGNISSSALGGYNEYYKLINNQKELSISGGSVTTDKIFNYPIYNENGTVNINGGTITSTSSNYSYGIYNASEGTINVNGGTITSTSTDGYAYGICNSSTGTINVNGGTLTVKATTSSYSGSFSYGIHNSSTGIINVNEGTITSTAKEMGGGLRSYSYGVYNYSTGIININGGTIKPSSSYYSYGIYNRTGTINVNGGTITMSSSSTSCGIYNRTGTINVNGGTISYYKFGICNDNTGTINVNGGTITSSSSSSSTLYGIYNYDTGTINVNGGTITSSSSSTSYGIYNYDTGTINIGTKGDGVVSKAQPNIKAEYTGLAPSNNGYGIYNTQGKIYFYDGIIQGSSRFGLGGITDIEDGYQIKEDTIDGYNSIYLEPKEDIYIVKNEVLNKEYTSLQEAIDETSDNEETKLKVLRDFDLKSNFEIPENKIINLDLASNTITNNYRIICNSGNLTIDDSIGNGNIMCNYTIYGIHNKGNLSIRGGTINSSCDSGTYSYGIINSGKGAVIINGGTIIGDNSSNSDINKEVYGIYNKSTGTVIVDSGKIQVSCSGITSGGRLRGIYNVSYGMVTLNGGIICINGTSESVYGIDNSNGKVNVTGGTISCTSNNSGTYGIYNSSGTINIEAGIISSSWCGINNLSGKINVEGGTIIGEVRGIETSSGIINIKRGTISVMDNSWFPYGVYSRGKSKITIGTKGDGIVSNTEPSIKAVYTGTNTSYGGVGIYNPSGELYFYDGRIEGRTLAIESNSKITEREDNTEFLYEDDDKVLTLTTEAMDIAKIGDTTYSSLQDAIDAAGTNQTTIELLRGVQYTNQDVSVNIASGKDIILDLKGFSIISAIEDSVITNNGKLKITDSTDEAKGKISGSYENTIHNKTGATLEVNNGTVTRIISKDNVVYNEGTLNVTGGTVLQPGDSGYTVYNTENSSLKVSSGTISGGNKSVYNKGNVNITNGTIGNGISNTDSGNLKIENGTITGIIQNGGNATVEITGGTISSSTYGINLTSGTVIVGAKDGSIVEAPSITGNTYGIYAQGGTLNIYDGTIKGKTSAISGEITGLEEQSEIVVSKGDEYETITLVKKDTPLAQVGTDEYYSLKEAISSISETGTVTILREGTVENTISNITGKDITLDLNGNTLKMYTRIQNTGTLKIADSSTEKTGNIISYKDSPIYNSGSLEFISGNISGNSYGIYNQDSGTTVICGGNLNSNTYGIYAVGGTVNVTSGTITENTYGTFANGGTVNVSGGSITNNQYGIYSSTGTTNVRAGTINTNNYGIYNQNGATNISEITLTGNTKEVYNGGTGTINIISGNITTSGETAIENASSGTIVVGTQDGNVVTESPVIQSEGYGITNSGNGTIKFYDGTIKGKKGGLSGLYLYLEIGYKVKTDYIDEYYCDTLAPAGTVSTVVKIGSIEYTNLQSAINACTSEEATTITLVNSISTNTAFTVEEGQNIIIDLNGKSIISSVAESTIENEGTLAIIDTSEDQTGKISNSYAVAIKNTGTLTLGQDDGTVSTTCPEISGNTFGIVNKGTFNFYDGTIKASVAIDGNVTSRPDNYVINRTTTDGIQKLVLAR